MHKADSYLPYFIPAFILCIAAISHNEIGGVPIQFLYVGCFISILFWILLVIRKKRAFQIIELLIRNKCFTVATIIDRDIYYYGGNESDYIRYIYTCEDSLSKKIWKSQYADEEYPIWAKVKVYHNANIQKKYTGLILVVWKWSKKISKTMNEKILHQGGHYHLTTLLTRL